LELVHTKEILGGRRYSGENRCWSALVIFIVSCLEPVEVLLVNMHHIPNHQKVIGYFKWKQKSEKERSERLPP